MNEIKQMQQMTFCDVSKEYKEFVGKFKPNKTTDDCYTPKLVYDAVADWASTRYGFDRSLIVRPFFPGGDFEQFEYPDGCVVLDNPPFSILSKIVRFYDGKKVPFFLFAPALTQLGILCGRNSVCCLTAHVDITYDNGANVKTSFVTNLDAEHAIDTAPDLRVSVKRANDENIRRSKAELPKYEFPMCVATSARLGWLSAHGEKYTVRKSDFCFVRSLDSMGARGIYGGGILLSERAAAERAAALRWPLSDRELLLQRMIGKRSDAS